MTPLAWIGLFILALPWLCSLTLVLWGLAIWWTRPRHPTPVTPKLVELVPPAPEKVWANECRDCGTCQAPDLTVCAVCSAGKSRLKTTNPDTTPYLWV